MFPWDVLFSLKTSSVAFGEERFIYLFILQNPQGNENLNLGFHFTGMHRFCQLQQPAWSEGRSWLVIETAARSKNETAGYAHEGTGLEALVKTNWSVQLASVGN